tara:strand:+ start:277 stop:519 length:243 start_codon:yes stop_codon:yes gene_type:complete
MIHGDIKQKEKTNTNIINNMINSTREWDWMDDNKLKDNNMNIIAMMDELRQYEIGNVTKAGLLESLKEFEAELIKNKKSI